MKYQTKYNNSTSYILLQTFMAMMDGYELDKESFYELTGSSVNVYRVIIKHLKEMIEELHLSCKLHQRKTTISTSKTEYKKISYKLINAIDYKYRIDDDISEYNLKMFMPCIAYIKLKGNQYITYNNFSVYFPNYDRHTFSNMISKLKEVIGEELYKDNYQSYVVEEIE